MQSYNRALSACKMYCEKNDVPFPPHNSAHLATYLCTIANASLRPKSVIATNIAALSNLYFHQNLTDITKDPCISRLITAIVKSGSLTPMRSAKVLPVNVFVNLFQTWDNNCIPISDLRLKTITLLALSLMLRPSDIAPRAKMFDFISGEEKSYLFKTDMLTFSPEGVQVTFHGIKNDIDRSGFKVLLPRLEDKNLDPVECLEVYLRRTQHLRSDGAVFLSLRKPFKAISASAVAKVLENAILRAGLGHMGYSAKSFRPTGATRAIEQGIHPDIVQKMGRWKTTEVFRDHYVHARTPENFSSAIINSV